MTLRVRLFCTSLLVALPLASGWFVIDTRMRLATKEQELRRSVDADIAAGLRERCEANPPATGRPGRGGGPAAPVRSDAAPPSRDAAGALDAGRRGNPNGPGRAGPRGPARGGSGAYQFFAYDASGHPSASDAPPLPEQRDGASSRIFWSDAGFGVSLVVPLGAAGPCAFLLARIAPPPGELRDQAEALLLVVMSVLAAAWVAAGPIIRRLRVLGDQVRQSAAAHYEVPAAIEGDDEIGSLADAFNAAGRRVRSHLVDVQQREETLRAFVANTTHDVAIPLTVLQGHLADLDRLLAERPDSRDHVRAAMQEAHYMTSLLRNLGAAVALEETNGGAHVTPVDLSALVERVVIRHQPIARALQVDLNFAAPNPPLVADSDPTLLEQALGNLVDNAIRYNHAGGHVAVLLDRMGDGFVLSVTDDGPGVPEAELEQLTMRWFRGSAARTRRPDGKGLGLAIAAESAKRLGLILTFSRAGEAGLRAEMRTGGVRRPPTSQGAV